MRKSASEKRVGADGAWAREEGWIGLDKLGVVCVCVCCGRQHLSIRLLLHSRNHSIRRRPRLTELESIPKSFKTHSK